MARPEAPVDRTVPARAELADFLRARRKSASVTYREMARITSGMPSKTTFERAASGASDPLLKTVETYVELTMTKEEEFDGGIGAAVDQARNLWIKARRATRAPYYLHKAPDPTLVSSRADFSRALRDQHVWAGYPSPGEMERMSGPGELPRSTTRRIIQGRSLPVTPNQASAFLKACYVDVTNLEPWLEAGVRIFERDEDVHSTYAWFRVLTSVREQNGRTSPTVATVGELEQRRMRKKGRERAA